MIPMRIPTGRVITIINTDDLYSGRYFVWGPPGCGKTTYLARQVLKILERYQHTLPEQQSPVVV